MQYVPLHVHTHYSLFDGLATPEEYAQRASDLGMDAVAITDHGTLSGHREWVRAMEAQGIKPILGIEAYFTEDRKDTRDKSERTEPLDLIYNHIVILAKNQEGLENLSRMNEIAWTEGFFKKPRIDWELLERYKDGLIVTSGCMSGLINKAVEAQEYAAAKRYIERLSDMFGDDFYIELMPHNTPGMNGELLALAQEMNVQAVVTPDCHHSHSDQKEAQELVLLLQTHAKVQKGSDFKGSQKYNDIMERLDYLYGEDRMLTFRNFDIHLLSGDEMQAAMEADGIFDESIYSNTQKIADKVENYSLPYDIDLLPKQYVDPDKDLRNKVEAGLRSKHLMIPEYMDRMEHELEIISSKKFAPYFLVVSNMIKWAKKNDILVGPGRGSAAGSLVNYALGITTIDPIEHDLLFERFIDFNRDDWPDIDVDVQDSRREEVKDYLIRQYRHVTAITTYSRFQDKGMVRDIARVFNIPLSDVNNTLKKIDTWDDYLRSPKIAEFRETHPEIAHFGEILRGRIRGAGTHAAGMVTSSEPIAKFAPIETRAAVGEKKRVKVVALEMNEAADVGLIKIDVLGLKTLSVIQDTLKAIEETKNLSLDLNTIPMDDRNVYMSLTAGHTVGVFQAEATPYTNLLMKMGVHSFDDLAASNALVRPGAMNTIGKDYIARKNGKDVVQQVHPIYDEIMKDTFGLCLYQEQQMRLCTDLAGLSTGDANRIRKVIGKKKDVSEFQEFKQAFINGASKHVSKELATKLWHDLEEWASYGFNKSHAVAYSTLSYWTAWLKHYYPLEFMYALLHNEADRDMITDYLIEAKRLGIKVKLPHINESDLKVRISGDALQLGLTAIKYVSDKIAQRYINKRPFASYEEVKEFTFTKGSGVNSRALEAMNSIGALNFRDNPTSRENVNSNMYEILGIPEFSSTLPDSMRRKAVPLAHYVEGSTSVVIGMVKKIKRGKGWSRIEIVDKSGTGGAFDKEHTDIEEGKMYIFLLSANRVSDFVPVSEWKESKSPIVTYLSRDIPLESREYYVIALKSRKTKAGQRMGNMVLLNKEGELADVVVFAKTYPQVYSQVKPGNRHKMDLKVTRQGSMTIDKVLS